MPKTTTQPFIMKYFINTFNYNQSAYLSRFPTDFKASPGQNMIACGYNDKSGLIGTFDENGDVVWESKYKTGKTQSGFVSMAQCPNGDYVVYGFKRRSGNLLYNTLTRINSDGDVLWSKQIFSAKTRKAVGLIQLSSGDFVTATWHVGPSPDDVEITKFDENGNKIRSVRLGSNADNQMSGIYRWADGFVVVGNTSAGKAWDGFIAFYNPDLSLMWKKLLGTGAFENIEAAVAGPNWQLILVGSTLYGGGNSKTFVVSLLGNETNGQIDVHTYDILEGNDRSRKIIYLGERYYILGNQSSPMRPYVLCLDLAFNVQWAKSIETEGECLLTDIIAKDENELWLCGRKKVNNNFYHSILIKTDLEIDTCSTVNLNDVEGGTISMNLQDWNASASNLEYTVEALDLKSEPAPSEKEALCPEHVFSWKDDAWLQSPYINLRACGSTGHDSPEGIFLRWFLLRDLGDHHLPKGNLAKSTANYNRPDDFVKIYRASYNPMDRSLQRTLNFEAKVPDEVSREKYFWEYRLEEDVAVRLHFHHHDHYLSLFNTIDPTVNTIEFLEAYGHRLLELELMHELAFSVSFDIAEMNPQTVLRAETWSVEGAEEQVSTHLSGRKKFERGLDGNMEMKGENIRSVKFSLSNGKLGKVTFKTYHAFFAVANKALAWQFIGQFALTSNDTEAHKRLEDSSRFRVDGQWNRFNNGRKVQVANYQQKWSKPEWEWDLREGVETYLRESDHIDNPKATVDLDGQDDQDGTNKINILDLLQMAALDYHVARMLGLGHIDTLDFIDSSEYQSFIYLMEYESATGIETNGSRFDEQHLFMSAPTSMMDWRLPQALMPLPITYGLEVQNGTSNPFQLTDANGYLTNDRSRYVGLRVKLETDFSKHFGFFQPAVSFCMLDFSAPILAGIEYKKQGEAVWRPLEVAHHHEFPTGFDKSNPPPTFETPVFPIEDDEETPLFVHKEIEEGVHEYAFYPINIFSRSSPQSNSIQTDETKFELPNTLLPPSIKAHLIQAESPLLLTTTAEQDLLDSLQDDKTLVRVILQYHHVHDRNYSFADKIEFLFREELPIEVMGGIASISEVSEEICLVTTKAYAYASTGESQMPNIPPEVVNNFQGGFLVVEEKQYEIVEVFSNNSNGDLPTFKIRKNEERQVHDLNGTVFTTRYWAGPR